MQLNDLRPAEGATHSKKRVGRGHGSGWGKTATRGYNGQGQRSGESTKIGFEGGQSRMYRQMPKKSHFTVPNRKEWAVVNLYDLDGFEPNTEITADFLRQAGVIKRNHDGLRVLGNGDVTVALVVKAHHVSASAREKIEKAGGRIELLGQSASTEA